VPEHETLKNQNHNQKPCRLLIILFLGSGLFIPACTSKPDAAQPACAGPNAATAQIQTPPQDEAPLFDYREIVLASGLRVVTLEDFSCPVVSVQMWYHVGSKNERPDRQGFAHMFEHMMFRGTDRLGPTDHFDLIRRTGGTSNGYTSFDRTVYLETLPAGQLELALWLEAERMNFLNITQENFQTERKVVEEERRLQLNQPYGTVAEKLAAELFKVHPYRWMPIGNMAHLRATSVKELRRFWRRYYVPNNAVLIIVGAVTHSEAQQQARRYFGWIPRCPDPPRVSINEPPAPKGRYLKIKDENAPAAAAGMIWRTAPAGDKDSVALEMLAGILGGGNSSRLYRTLVAEKQVAVAAEAIAWALEQDGVFGAGALLAPGAGDANEVIDLIRTQVQRLADQRATDRELTKVRNQMLKELVTTSMTIDSKASMLGNAAILENDISRVNKKLAEIRSITTDDLMRVARKYLSPARAIVVAVDQNVPEAVTPAASAEESASITAKPEEVAPLPGRSGVVRPVDFPKEPPFAAVKPSKYTPAYTQAVLSNGLKVMVVPNNEVPFVSIQLGLLAGAWAEEKPGAASMTLEMITKGTENFTEAQLADELETYAISLEGKGETDSAAVTARCLSEHVERAMQLLAEVVLRPAFDADEFEKLRKRVLTSLTIASAEPDYIADRQLRRCLFGDHPYGRTPRGEISDVKALTVEDVRNYWQRFATPEEAVLIFSGDIDHQTAVGLAEKMLGAWQPTGLADIPLPGPIPPVGPLHIYLVNQPGSSQSQIRIGAPGITRRHADYFVSRLVSSYFGGGFNSRLNAAIRVKKGLTYSIWAGFIPGRFAGRFELSTFSRTQTTADAVAAALNEIKTLRTTPPSQDELEHNRSYILGAFVRHRETPQDIASDLWLIESQQLPADYLDRFLAGVAGAGIDDCARFASRAVDTSNLVVVIVGDAAKLKAPLEQIAPVTVVAAGQSP